MNRTRFVSQSGPLATPWLVLSGLLACASLAFFLFWAPGRAAEHAVSLPAASVDTPTAHGAGQQTAVFAGGCFWGIQAVFQHVNGVISATSGYAGGTLRNPSYEEVSSGTTGHAESVQVVYDPGKISYGQLLRVFFSVAHDPTELNRQGPDTGTQYRSALFFSSPEQENIARSYVRQLDTAHVFARPIVTQISPLSQFYMAEAHHQDYAKKHPDSPYIVINDLPKVDALRAQFPELYRAN